MPFTFAHPAASVPLRRLLGQYGVLSALVIGSLTPDFAYFLPLEIPRSASHSFLGLLWFCVPIGLLTYILYHVFLKRPLLWLLPLGVRRRLSRDISTARTLPTTPWLAVVVSVLCGATTHIVWDAFTHVDGLGVTALPLLQRELFAVGTYSVYGYKLLQHGSTVVGLALLAGWSWRFLASTTPDNESLPVTFSPEKQVALVVLMVGASVGVGMWMAARALAETCLTGMAALQFFVGRAIFTGLPILGLTVLVYSIAWHLWQLRKPSAG